MNMDSFVIKEKNIGNYYMNETNNQTNIKLLNCSIT